VARSAEAAPALVQRPAVVRVQPDGTVQAPTNALTARLGGATAAAAWVQYRFGMPTNSPVEREQEDDALPVLHTTWRHGGILYRQSVMVTRLGRDEQKPTADSPADMVLLVKLAGENEASYYTNGKAAFVMEIEGQPLRLAFTNGLAYAAAAQRSLPVAWVDIPAGGVVGTNVRGLTFEGNLPPGLSGAMTIKIPSTPELTSAETDRLGDLDFDEELQRLRKAWKALRPEDRPRFVLIR
jgi:hypothetical protein